MMRSVPRLPPTPAVRLALALCLTAIAGGCADRLTAPQAYELLEVMSESEGADGGPGARFASATGLPLAGLSSRLPTVRVQRSLRATGYHALVFERVMIPEQGAHPGGDCAGRRRILLLERGGDHGESLTFVTGPGERTIDRTSPSFGCTSHDGHPVAMLRDMTTLRWSRRAPGTSGQVWVAISGEGSISEGDAVGACAFLSEEAARSLDEDGVRCELTRHRVWFAATLREHPEDGDAPHTTTGGHRPARARATATETMRLPRSTVTGVRVTIDCHHSERTARLFCGGAGPGP